jgi:hypothetical protein
MISCLYPNRYVLWEFIIVNVSKNPLLVVSRVQHGARRFDSLANPSPALTWISGQDPLLLVVTTQKNPLIRIACSFIFRVIVTLCIIMHL